MDNFVYIPTAKGLAQLPPPTQPQAQPLASTLTPTALTRSETVGSVGGGAAENYVKIMRLYTPRATNGQALRFTFLRPLMRDKPN